MNRLKVMVTGAALAAASGGAWGVNAVLNIDSRGCCTWGSVGKLSGSPDGSFIPYGMPFVTGSSFAFSQASTPIAILQLTRADKDGTGNMVNFNQNSENKSDSSLTRRERGYYLPARLPAEVQDAIRGAHDVKVNVLVQYIEAQDLFIRPETAFCPDFHTQGTYDGLELGIFGPSHVNAAYNAPIIDLQPISKLNKPIQRISGNFDNSKFCDTNKGVQIAQRADLEGKKHFSFWSVLRTQDKRQTFVTAHWIILNEETAHRMKQQICLADLIIKYKGYYNGDGLTFADIYNTNLKGRANLIAYCKEIGVQPPSDNATTDELQSKWKQIIEGPGATASLVKPGRGLLAFINFCYNFLEKKDTKGKLEEDLKDHGRTFWGVCNNK
ncbi:MAG: hypothetical protein LBG13_02570 [Holosporales bacterium]|jgi:hypothetical protein|nr:hypothetical protein [Holosporales bacterium]